MLLYIFVLGAHFSFQGYASKKGAELSDEILETAQTFHSASPAVHEIAVFRSGYTSSHSHGNVEGFLSLRPTSSSVFVAFCFVIAILSGVRQDLDCSFDSSFSNEPQKVDFSVIYWPTGLLHLESTCSIHLLVYCVFCILLTVQFFMF